MEELGDFIRLEYAHGEAEDVQPQYWEHITRAMELWAASRVDTLLVLTTKDNARFVILAGQIQAALYSTPQTRANYSARDLLFKAERRQNGIFDE